MSAPRTDEEVRARIGEGRRSALFAAQALDPRRGPVEREKAARLLSFAVADLQSALAAVEWLTDGGPQ